MVSLIIAILARGARRVFLYGFVEVLPIAAGKDFEC